jgi:hypothetical protein
MTCPPNAFMTGDDLLVLPARRCGYAQLGAFRYSSSNLLFPNDPCSSSSSRTIRVPRAVAFGAGKAWAHRKSGAK